MSQTCHNRTHAPQQIWRCQSKNGSRRLPLARPGQAVVAETRDEGRAGLLRFLHDGHEEWFLWAKLHQAGRWHQVPWFFYGDPRQGGRKKIRPRTSPEPDPIRRGVQPPATIKIYIVASIAPVKRGSLASESCGRRESRG
jgi:hypothetical protein